MLLQLYAHKIATNPTQEMVSALLVVLGIDKANLQRRTLRVIKSILASGYAVVIPAEMVARLKNSGDREVAEMITELYR
jgi:S-adenosylmethionine:tRNA-ribosyltransferase-isomerase (queuine synthetase)